MSNYDKLQKVLQELFQLNQAKDLDFGIYRIINQKRELITDFLENKLRRDIQTILKESQGNDAARLQKELKEAEEDAYNLGMSPQAVPKVVQLKKDLAKFASTDELEQEVYSHLTNFFRRYYKDGDFISQRRYKQDVYAIPYEGEEVKLHWANKDQYYIKTSEYFQNYNFRVGADQLVEFRLKDATTEINNNKANKDDERRFELYQEAPMLIDGNTLIIYFTYELHKKSIKQDKLMDEAYAYIKDNLPKDFNDLLRLSPTDKNKNRTLLEKHLATYVARNTFDYFIHKDLEKFLSRELDFYIKNEVLFLDDIDTSDEVSFQAQMTKIRAIKAVAKKLIAFLAQIENFQKKLWLKKKVVVESNYCITLDKIDEQFYPEILENKRQLEEWYKLYGINIKTLSDLKNEPFTVLDTKFFTEEFKDRLLSQFIDLDNELDGLLVNSENFQALQLLKKKFKNKVKTIYIDPPYNTGSDGFLYKDNYQSSSWLSLLSDRLNQAKNYLTDEGVIQISIDDKQDANLKQLLNSCLGESNFTAKLVWEQGRKSMSKQVAINHEYCYVYSKNKDENVIYSNNYVYRNYWKTKKEGLDEIYKHFEKLKIKYKDNYEAIEKGMNSFYKKLDDANPSKKHKHYKKVDAKGLFFPDNIAQGTGKGGRFDVIHPSSRKPCKVPSGGWRFSEENLPKYLAEDRIYFGEDETTVPCIKRYLRETEYEVFASVFYKDGRGATNRIKEMFGKKIFDHPKDEEVITTLLSLNTHQEDYNTLILDFFAGSGTTAHASIKLNKVDGGTRKYILVEMGGYFNSVTKPRIQKVIYSENWKDGKPLDKKGISQMFKYIKLESYEDALNNLELDSVGLFGKEDKVGEEYMLNYMLDIESQSHLFNVDVFKHPFNYQMKITENNELKLSKVDLVETFNYLIGLKVHSILPFDQLRIIEGENPEGEKVLVIWRDLEAISGKELNDRLNSLSINVNDREYDLIYVNGDHHLDNFRKDESRWKVQLIEETFFKNMFDLNTL